MNETNTKETGVTPRRAFTEEYKRHAVELTLRGDRTARHIAADLGIPASALYEWRKQYAPRPGAKGPAPQTLEAAQQEVERLRGEVLRLREREIVLKKSLGILSEPPERSMPALRP